MYVCIRVDHKAGPCTATFNDLFHVRVSHDADYGSCWFLGCVAVNSGRCSHTSRLRRQ
jgi:hypothetical protein